MTGTPPQPSNKMRSYPGLAAAVDGLLYVFGGQYYDNALGAEGKSKAMTRDCLLAFVAASTQILNAYMSLHSNAGCQTVALALRKPLLSNSLSRSHTKKRPR